ncbi:hypothetical protein ACLMJK_002299 [Lecanora helva]
MSQDLSETNRLLVEILSAIRGLDQSLNLHEKRISDLEKLPEAEQERPESVSTKHVRLVPKAEQTIGLMLNHRNSPSRYLEQLYCNSLDVGERPSWSEFIGDAWSLPLDQRIDLGFQKQYLEKLSSYDLDLRLKAVQNFNNNLLATATPIEANFLKRRNWFRHFTIEDTLPYPPVESWIYTVGLLNARSSFHATLTTHPTLSQQSGVTFEHQDVQRYSFENEGCSPDDAPFQRLM